MEKNTELKNNLAKGLYIVATPIGNLGDLSPRAIETLKHSDIIFCEDTRVTSKLLSSFGIKGRLVVYNDYSNEKVRERILTMLDGGARISLVSDAGTPLISDPGYKLVASVKTAGHKIYTIPGPSAVIAALSIAGLPTDRFTFAGFAPNKRKARQDWFKDLKKLDTTLVLFESNHRLKDCLKDAVETLGTRKATVCRELTKKFEETISGTLSELVELYESDHAVKGEVVLVIEGGNEQDNTDRFTDDENFKTVLSGLIKSYGVKKASNLFADITGQSRREIYEYAQKLKDTEKLQ